MSKPYSALLALGLSLAGTSAFAHAQLQSAEPAVGGTVSGSPPEIRLHYSEGVEGNFSSIALTTETGAAVGIGRAAVAPGDQTTFVSRITKPLKPGTYKVTWHVVSVDTHKTQGSFEFTVAP